jgi:hypothetical protein
MKSQSMRFPRRSRNKPHSSKPGADASGAVGSVKKLPTKKPTPHLANDPLPLGAVNRRGQKKYMDPTTGKIAMIDMRTPRVLGPRGLPVKG